MNHQRHLAPLCFEHGPDEFPIANLPIKHHRVHAIGNSPIGAELGTWLQPKDIAGFLASGASEMIDARGHRIARHLHHPSTHHPYHAEESFLIQYPWDLLRANELALASLTETYLHGNVHPSAVIDGTLQLAAGAKILPGVVVEGHVVIGENSKIGPNCYLRGHTSIGANCHVGQAVEIKNSIVLDYTSVGHLSYVGDSILGRHVNFGAGTITSNFRHDGNHHASMIGETLIDTERTKFGAIVGDHVHTGIHTAIYPGRKIWPHQSTRPGDIVQKDLKP